MPNTFKRNVLIAFGFSLLLLLLSSIASYVSIRNLITSAERVEHTNSIISELEQVNVLLQESESSQRGFLLSADASFLVPYQNNSKVIASKLGRIKQLTSDNPLQVKNISRLEYLIGQRFAILDNGIEARRRGTLVSNEVLLRGKSFMDETNGLIRQMEEVEKNLYEQRSARFKLLITLTPIIIVFAAFLSIVITVFFYGRIVSDYRKRVNLQEELQQKDAQISKRLDILRNIATEISDGNYKVRVGDDAKDSLGNLANTVNRMAESLDFSFGIISEK